MVEVKVFKKVNVTPLSESTLKVILAERIQDELPPDVSITDLDFIIKRNPTRVELSVKAKFDDTEEEDTPEDDEDDTLLEELLDADNEASEPEAAKDPEAAPQVPDIFASSADKPETEKSVIEIFN